MAQARHELHFSTTPTPRKCGKGRTIKDTLQYSSQTAKGKQGHTGMEKIEIGHCKA